MFLLVATILFADGSTLRTDISAYESHKDCQAIVAVLAPRFNGSLACEAGV